MSRLQVLGWILSAVAGALIGVLLEEHEWRRIQAAAHAPFDSEGGWTTSHPAGW